MTGHILEWASICPPELRPPDPVLRRAAQACLNTLKARPEIFSNQYAGATHAVRGLFQLSMRHPEKSPDD